jgi:hypothetical protein
MLRILLFLFTLNALLLPISGYAGLSVSESVAPMLMGDQSNSAYTASTLDSIKCSMPSPCLNCDMSNMNASCGLDCNAHCLGSVAALSDMFHLSIYVATNTEILTAFKHFYSHTFAPELRPPLA